MNPGTFLIIAGILFAVAYVFFNPQFLVSISDKLTATSRKIVETKVDLGFEDQGARPTSQSPLEDQVLRAVKGDFLNIDFAGGNSITAPEHTVLGRGVLTALNFNQKTKVYSPKGELYQVLFADGDVVLFKRPDGWYIFNKRQILIGDEAKLFHAPGVLFGNEQKNQQPDSVEFTWRNRQLLIQDTGYMDFKLTSGECHIRDGMRIKYMLVKDKDTGELLMIENLMDGADSVWSGNAIGQSLKGFITNVLSAVA